MRSLTFALVVLGVLAPLSAAGAATSTTAPARSVQTGVVDVVQVSGWLDPVTVDFLEKSIEKAATESKTENVQAVVVQLDSPGALVDRSTFDHLLASVRTSPVPVAVWVGPAGSEALREAGELVVAAPLAGMAPHSTVEVDGHVLNPAQAQAAGVVQFDVQHAATLPNFVGFLDGHQVGSRTIVTSTTTVGTDGVARPSLIVQTRLAKLDLVPRFLHTAASPPIAYLLLVAGMALAVFELFTAGGGIAASVAIVAFVLSGYGLDVLPTNLWGVALLVFATFGFAVDVQTGVPRVWTGIGVVSFVAGSLVLYRSPVSLGWLPLAGGLLGMVLLMLAGLPATIRSRFSTPTIGRESMIGEEGEVVADLHPQGVVRVRSALWPARTNRATPAAVGDRIRVVGVVGAQLEVTPDLVAEP
ncbi:MAG TPA: NfeD family protein [Acidimicrobiales bacterium]|jgi:membrane-bound serine protease (ClpP class)